MNTKKVIINADDFGKDENVTTAIAESFRRGFITRTTLMVNMPWTEKAVLLAKEEGFADKVGLHLNLTESVSGEKATMPSDMSALRKEICLQIEKFLSFGLKSRHCDSHHHVHFRPKVAYALMPLLKHYGFKSVRRPYNISLGCTFGGMVRHMRNGLFVAYAWLNGLETTKLFGGVSDVENINDIEIMVHPVYSSSGQLFNAEQFDKSTGKPLFGRPMSDFHSIRVAI